MRIIFRWGPPLLVVGLLLSVPLVIASCEMGTPPPPVAVDLEPFKEMARRAECADYANRLFLIDQQLVLWDRRGNCPDRGYHQRLYQGTVDRLLCERFDSVAGPIERCADEDYRNLFRRMVENLEEPDLGLGDLHHVVRIEGW
jgi:hypothetical protein